MKKDRFLLGILIGIGILVLLAVVRVLTYSPAEMTYGEETTPQGVVHNYLVAVYRQEYERAYSYLADKAKKPTLDGFRRSFLMGMVDPKQAMVQVGKAEIVDETQARVEVNIIYVSSDPIRRELQQRPIRLPGTSGWGMEDRVHAVSFLGWELVRGAPGFAWRLIRPRSAKAKGEPSGTGLLIRGARVLFKFRRFS